MNNLDTATIAYGSLVVSGLAVLLTVVAFWSTNLKKGRLEGYEPRTFAASDEIVRLPLVVLNTGAIPIVVQDLRLKFKGQDDPMLWRSSRSRLEPAGNDERRVPEVFAVPAKETKQLFMDFSWSEAHREIPNDQDTVTVEVLVGRKAKWKPLLKFELRLDLRIHKGPFIAYSNDPDAMWGLSTIKPHDDYPK